MLARHPRLRLIVAHMGMPEYEEFLDLAERYDEVRLDTTMAFTDFTEGLMPFPRRALPRLAALGDRILLGSDFPNIPYPYLHQLHALERLDLGPEWLRAVCHDNARSCSACDGAADTCHGQGGERAASTSPGVTALPPGKHRLCYPEDRDSFRRPASPSRARVKMLSGGVDGHA